MSRRLGISGLSVIAAVMAAGMMPQQQFVESEPRNPKPPKAEPPRIHKWAAPSEQAGGRAAQRRLRQIARQQP